MLCKLYHLHARCCLLALSPAAARQVALDASMPDGAAAALASYEAGAVVKVVQCYPSRFWAEKGLSGAVLFAEPHGVSALDASMPDQARLVMFVGGPSAMAVGAWPTKRLHGWVLDLLTLAFGEQARRPVAVADGRWLPHPWLTGGYVARITPEGRADAAQVLRDAPGRVHCADSEVASRFPGFVEGAVISGREAAQRIARNLEHSVRHSSILSKDSGSSRF